jgi:EAL domain-containing protein (putative c-di-GMP-specific phosphodiesterase class I)/GGDEF domain-containing protein
MAWALLGQDADRFWFIEHSSAQPLHLESRFGHSIADGLTLAQLGQLAMGNNLNFLVVHWPKYWVVVESQTPLPTWLQQFLLAGSAMGLESVFNQQGELLSHLIEAPDSLFMNRWLQLSLARFMPCQHLAWLGVEGDITLIFGDRNLLESIGRKLATKFGALRIPHQGGHVGCLRVAIGARSLLVLAEHDGYQYQPSHQSTVLEVLDYYERLDQLREHLAHHSSSPSPVQRHMLMQLDKTRRYWKSAAYRQLNDATGLPNLYQLDQRFSQLMMRQRNSHRPGVALMVSEFGKILDYMTDEQRNSVLKTVAQRWRRTLRGHDLLLYSGERQFVILLERVADNAMIKRVIGRLLSSLRPPVQLDGLTAVVDCVIGVREFDSLEDVGPERALSQALEAMHLAQSRNSQWGFFDPKARMTRSHRQQVAQRLAQAIAGQKMRTQFQPIIRLQDNQLLGFEMNACWPSALPEWLCHHSLTSTAHEYGLIKALDYELIKRIGSDSEMVSSSIAAVHLSGDHLSSHQSVLALVNVLEALELPRRQILLEFSEPEVVSHNGQAIESLNVLKDYGFVLGMDEFGLGHSPLDMLMEYPVTYLKVADEVTHRLPDPATSRWFKVVRDICNELEMHLVVNGIDDLQHHHQVLKLGCEYGQGDYIARPMSEQLAKALLKRH